MEVGMQRKLVEIFVRILRPSTQNLGKGRANCRLELNFPPSPFDIEIFLRSIFLCQEKKQTFPRVISFLKLLGEESLLFSVE